MEAFGRSDRGRGGHPSSGSCWRTIWLTAAKPRRRLEQLCSPSLIPGLATPATSPRHISAQTRRCTSRRRLGSPKTRRPPSRAALYPGADGHPRPAPTMFNHGRRRTLLSPPRGHGTRGLSPFFAPGFPPPDRPDGVCRRKPTIIPPRRHCLYRQPHHARSATPK